MRRTGFSALILIATMGFASAQQVTALGAVHGQTWNMGQDLNRMEATQRLPSPLATDRAARARRQAQFNRSFPGTPIR
ncbi:MAG: hypothetical protein JWR10_4668 [Rubritepida sp.]|nr:hypothetical protein [Rubritepida sp.]